MFRKREIVQAIYKEGGFSKAAKVLHIAQPSLSVMVSNIEKEIGARIFDRSTNPIALTQIGAKYLECSEQITIIEDDFRNYVNEVRGLEIGTLSIGANTLYISNLLPDIITEYSGRHPSININLYDHDSPALISMLVSGALDVAIDNLTDNDKLEKHYLGTEYLFIAVPEDDPVNLRLKDYAYSYRDITDGIHMKSSRYLHDLYAFRDKPFIMLQKGFDTRRRCDYVLHDYGIQVKALYDLNQLSSAFGMAASGLGLTVVSDTLIRHSPDWGSKMRYYTVDHDEFIRYVFCYTVKNRMLTRAVEEFVSISRELSPILLSSGYSTQADKIDN